LEAATETREKLGFITAIEMVESEVVYPGVKGVDATAGRNKTYPVAKVGAAAAAVPV